MYSHPPSAFAELPSIPVGTIAQSRSAPRRAWSWRAAIVGVWGLGFVVASFVEFLVRHGATAFVHLPGQLDGVGWVALALTVTAFGYGEGYMVLHKRFAPALVERAVVAPPPSRWWAVALAPLYVLELIGSEPARMRRAWLALVLIVAAVFLVRATPAPWRQIIDAGVGVALAIGLGSIVCRTAARVGRPRRR